MLNSAKSLIVRGPLGVGKTSVAKLVAEKLSAIYVSVDDLLEENRLDFSPDGNGIPVDHFLRVNEIIGSIPQRPLVVDGNFYYRRQIDDLVERLDGVKVFTLTAPLEVCIERDAQRPHPHGADAATAVYKMVAKLEVGKIVGTGHMSPAAAVDSIISSIDRDH